MTMDAEIQFYLERKFGLSFNDFPSEGIEIGESTKHRDTPWKRMSIVRIGHGVLATGIARVIRAIEPVIKDMSVWELFHSTGVAELQRTLSPSDAETLREGFHYSIKKKQYIRRQALSEAVTKVLESDSPLDNTEFNSGSQRTPSNQYFQPAFAIYEEDKEVASSGIHWLSSHLVEIGVETSKAYQKKGYGLLVVASATEWILGQGAVVYYRAYPSNIGSVRIARKMGFKLIWQNIYA
jgi:GNAT superfamily N-acetyltransferase